MSIDDLNNDIEDLEFEIDQINRDIKKAQEGKNTGIAIMIVSIFFLWPLLIVGGIMYSNNNNKEKELTSKRARLEHEIYRIEKQIRSRNQE